MKILKILLLTSSFLLTNCSLINDKLISRKGSSDETDNQEIAVTDEKLPTEVIVDERVYKDEKELDISSEDGLQGDIEAQDDEDYPKLADIPNRPDPAISIEDQKQIIKSIEDNNPRLEPSPNVPIIEDKVSNLDIDNKTKKLKSYDNPNDSIRNILDSKLNEIDTYKDNLKNLPKRDVVLDEQEKELKDLAKQLKNIKTIDQVNEIEKKIKKNDLYYTPQDINDILGLGSRDQVSNVVSQKKTEQNKVEKKDLIEVETNIVKSEIVEQIDKREIPVARITFNHGSTQLTDEDFVKIKQVANLFYENEGKKIVIVGHSSSRTNYDMDLTKHALVNFNISLERARKVMSKFSEVGLKSEKIELVAMSDAKPLYAEIMPRLEAANRRAEIFIQY
tara:strand:+ start:629 stop:1804 length:1176 start_codon:yes stop_codon:yes gene_type:complete